jgi:hypothetical protein
LYYSDIKKKQLEPIMINYTRECPNMSIVIKLHSTKTKIKNKKIKEKKDIIFLSGIKNIQS